MNKLVKKDKKMNPRKERMEIRLQRMVEEQSRQTGGECRSPRCWAILSKGSWMRAGEGAGEVMIRSDRWRGSSSKRLSLDNLWLFFRRVTGKMIQATVNDATRQLQLRDLCCQLGTVR